MILMFQKEVAERFVAKPKTKDYGLLTVMAQLHWKIDKVSDAAPRDFFPAPKVASRVLRWRRLEGPPQSERFLKFLKAAFQFRRKFLLKNIKGSVKKGDEDRLKSIFEELGINPQARAEELSPQKFVELFNAVNE